ncbi:pro-FMRFamide-related neuropeptide VF [Chanos chanos]|uniref:Pro-FMRFamide-related neuropeptide VF n=1 Tax=Chanos chanos TaxID=29144 RepID=A0A6J2WJB8_CHACN|nr:uncharacterized protein LOC115824912 [Chanos chanos]
MFSSNLLTFTLTVLASLLLQRVITLRLPGADDDNQHRFTRQYSESSNEIPRSLEMEDFTFKVLPTSGRVSTPSILRLHPASVKPSHLHANLPLRFGRDDGMSKSTINLPQRFGRAQEKDGLIYPHVCTQCRRSGSPPSATLPQRFGRGDLFNREPFRNLVMSTRAMKSPFLDDRTLENAYEDEMMKNPKLVSSCIMYHVLYTHSLLYGLRNVWRSRACHRPVSWSLRSVHHPAIITGHFHYGHGGTMLPESLNIY